MEFKNELEAVLNKAQTMEEPVLYSIDKQEPLFRAIVWAYGQPLPGELTGLVKNITRERRPGGLLTCTTTIREREHHTGSVQHTLEPGQSLVVYLQESHYREAKVYLDELLKDRIATFNLTELGIDLYADGKIRTHSGIMNEINYKTRKPGFYFAHYTEPNEQRIAFSQIAESQINGTFKPVKNVAVEAADIVKEQGEYAAHQMASLGKAIEPVPVKQMYTVVWDEVTTKTTNTVAESQEEANEAVKGWVATQVDGTVNIVIRDVNNFDVNPDPNKYTEVFTSEPEKKGPSIDPTLLDYMVETFNADNQDPEQEDFLAGAIEAIELIRERLNY